MPKNELPKQDKISTEGLVRKVLDSSEITGLSIAPAENAQLRHTDADFSRSSW